jgi:hypothetical protein
LCDILHSPVNWPFLSSNVFLSTQFLNTLSLYSSLNVRNQSLI